MTAVWPSGIVTLLTDFGAHDPFVGVMKGIVLGMAPKARVIDLAHNLAPHDVVAGAFWLEASHAYFAPGSVHVAVIDPGVGTSRRAIAASALGHYFVGPDNGLIAGVIARDPKARAVALDAARAGRGTVPSRTFHGRDLFAPAAARICRGVPLASLGDAVDLTTLVPSVLPQALPSGNGAVEGVVLFADRFGNLFTNLDAALLEPTPGSDTSRTPGHLRVGDRVLRCGSTYADGADGEAIGLANSFGVIEIAVRGASARDHLGLAPGAAVRFEREALERRAKSDERRATRIKM
jgi:S-adenosylmethionine hydrolase